jgi:hypothetical protein
MLKLLLGLQWGLISPSFPCYFLPFSFPRVYRPKSCVQCIRNLPTIIHPGIGFLVKLICEIISEGIWDTKLWLWSLHSQSNNEGFIYGSMFSMNTWKSTTTNIYIHWKISLTHDKLSVWEIWEGGRINIKLVYFLGPVTHAYNTSCSGGKDLEDGSSMPTQANSFWNLILKISNLKKSW